MFDPSELNPEREIILFVYVLLNNMRVFQIQKSVQTTPTDASNEANVVQLAYLMANIEFEVKNITVERHMKLFSFAMMLCNRAGYSIQSIRQSTFVHIWPIYLL